MEYGGRGKPYQFTVTGYVVYDKKIVLVKHKKSNMWLPPGGHMEQDENNFFKETPEEAIIREVKEETGLHVEIVGKRFDEFSDKRRKMLTIPENLHIHEIDVHHDHLNFDYFCRVLGSTDGKGVEDYRWFSSEEIDAYPDDAEIEMPKHVKFIAKEAIKRLSD